MVIVGRAKYKRTREIWRGNDAKGAPNFRAYSSREAIFACISCVYFAEIAKFETTPSQESWTFEFLFFSAGLSGEPSWWGSKGAGSCPESTEKTPRAMRYHHLVTFIRWELFKKESLLSAFSSKETMLFIFDFWLFLLPNIFLFKNFWMMDPFFKGSISLKLFISWLIFLFSLSLLWTLLFKGGP